MRSLGLGMLLVVGGLLGTAGRLHAACDETCSSGVIDSSFCVTGTPTDVGAVTQPASVVFRDGGAAGYVGPYLLWTFGDTLYTGHSQTAAVSPPLVPGFMSHSEELDASGVPFQFVPFTSQETDHNLNQQRDAHCNAGRCAFDTRVTCTLDTDCLGRYALWPTRPVEVSSSGCATRWSSSCTGTGAIYFGKYFIRKYVQGTTDPCNLCYVWLGTGLAQVSEGPPLTFSTRAQRQVDGLFVPGDPAFAPMLVEGGYIYLAAHGSGGAKFARVAVGSRASRGAYTYWHANPGGGGSWTTSIGSATVDPNFNGETVSWNPFVGKYIATWAMPFTTDFYILASSTVHGPWSQPVKVWTGPAGAGYPEEHPEVALPAGVGQTIYMSYSAYNGNAIRVVRFQLKRVP